MYQEEYAPEYKQVIEWVLKSVEKYTALKPNSILEIGCGLGYSTEILRNTFENIKIDAIDICKTGIKHCPSLELVDFTCGTFITF